MGGDRPAPLQPAELIARQSEPAGAASVEAAGALESSSKWSTEADGDAAR